MIYRGVKLLAGVGALIAGRATSSAVRANPASAVTTLFVSMGGSDANPCSNSAPCAAIR
jgi:hypothetical protein